MYETFDHTADLGLRVRAATLPELFTDAGRGLAAMLVEDLSTVRPAERVEITLPTDDLEYLFFDWLKTLLSLFDERRLLLVDFEVTIGEKGLAAVAHGEPLDEARHEPAHEVKAITYHALRVEQEDAGWLAEVIVDI